jgi:hypothetical protein
MRLATSLPVVMYLAVLFACGHPSVAPVTSDTPPTELRVPGLDEYRGNPRLIADRIYVLGRSETRIAYVNESADEACGCYTPESVVLDLKSNHVVWKDSYDSGELDPANKSQLRNLEQLWRARGADWERHVREQGVTPSPTRALVTIPTGSSEVPRIEIHEEKVGADSPEGYAHLTGYRIELVTSNGTTTIASSPSQAEYDLLGVAVPGYLPPPGSGSAAVLVRETRRGWEGSPSVELLRFVGADLHADPR